MRLKKIFGIVSLLLILGIGGALVGVWLGQDRLVQLFVQGANRYLRVPVQVGHIKVSLWEEFPRVSIALRDVVVRGSLAQDTVPLARVRSLRFALNPWDMLVGRYRIRAVSVADGRVRVAHDAQGRPNYEVLRFDTAAATDEPLRFALEDVRVQRITTVYDDQARQQRVAGHTPDLRASLRVVGDLVTVQARGVTRVQAIYLGPDAYARDKELTMQTTFVVDRQRRVLTLRPSTIRIGAASYEVAGPIVYEAAPVLDLRVQGQHTDVQSLVALLPARLTRQFVGYRSRGEVYFRGTVRGELSGTASPHIRAEFGCRDAAFYHPASGETLEHVFATGTVTNGAAHSLSSTEIMVRDGRGQLRGRAISGNVRYANLLDPTVALDLRAELDVASALRFFPLSMVRSGTGYARVALQFNGNLRRFRQQSSRADQARGEMTLQNVRLQLRDYRQPLTNLTGTVQLRGHEVTVTQLTGRLGQSDFQLSGTFSNAPGWLLARDRPLAARVDFRARHLNFDELLQLKTSPPPVGNGKAATRPARDYAFRLPRTVALDLTATVQSVRFRRFRGHDLRGTFRLRNQVLAFSGVRLTALGGQASGQGTLDARLPDRLKVSSTATCSRLPLDSLFYVFEDFGQRFVTARHLRGTLTATAESDVYFDRHLTPLTDRVEAEIKATVRDGQLNNFEPAQKLSMLASREQLRHLRFAELTNNFYIQSRTVYLPEMEIRSNVRLGSLIRVTGTHTFDQRLEYHLTIPILPGLFRRPADALGMRGPNLLLAVRGTEDNFRVSYDAGRRSSAGRPPAGPATGNPAPPASAAQAGPAAPGPTPARPVPFAVPGRRTTPAAPEKAKKPSQPQPGGYFDF